nr:RRXRR domain-containing protein [Candidatus Freyarchaeota archaeon]
MSTLKIPVVGKDGKTLTPCTTAKARKLLCDGVAEKKWNKPRIFHIQMLVGKRRRTSKMHLSLDNSSKVDGVAIVSKKKVLRTRMLEFPKGVAKGWSREGDRGVLEGTENTEEDIVGSATESVRAEGFCE